MQANFHLTMVCLVLALCGSAMAAESPQPNDPLAALVPPDVLLKQRADLDLDDEQVRALEAVIEEVGPKFARKSEVEPGALVQPLARGPTPAQPKARHGAQMQRRWRRALPAMPRQPRPRPSPHRR